MISVRTFHKKSSLDNDVFASIFGKISISSYSKVEFRTFKIQLALHDSYLSLVLVDFFQNIYSGSCFIFYIKFKEYQSLQPLWIKSS
jgi:hypothetical protein